MSKKVRILVVEDEMLIGAKIAMFLEELGYEVAAIIPRAEDALLIVAAEPLDLALVDVQLLGEMDGIELAKRLGTIHRLPVIFLTANTDEATFESAKVAQPYAFLQKPFRKTELQRTIALALQRIAAETLEPDAESAAPTTDESFVMHDRIFVRHNDKMIKLLFDDILHVVAERSYCRIVTSDREFLLTMPMKRLEDRLPATLFQRIHRSYIVNIRRIDEVSDGTVRIGSQNLPLSTTMRAEFLRRLNAV